MGYKPLLGLAGVVAAGLALSGCQTSRPADRSPRVDSAWNNPRSQQTPLAGNDGQAAGTYNPASDGRITGTPAPSGSGLDTSSGIQPVTGKQTGLDAHSGGAQTNLGATSLPGPGSDPNMGPGAGSASPPSGSASGSVLTPPVAPAGTNPSSTQSSAPMNAPQYGAPLPTSPGADLRSPSDPTPVPAGGAPTMPLGGSDVGRQTSNMSPVSGLIKPYPTQPSGLSTAQPAPLSDPPATSFAPPDDVPVMKPGQSPE